MSVSRFEWERVVRRLTLKSSTKLVALTLATYADRDGTNAHPGVDRLACDCSLNPDVVRRHLKILREQIGLLERTVEGSKQGRRRLADSYDLAVPADLLQRVSLTSYHPTAPSSDYPPGSPVDNVDHPTLESADPTSITRLSGRDHPTLQKDHPTLESLSPDSRVDPPSMITDVYQPSPRRRHLLAEPNDPSPVDNRCAIHPSGRETIDGDCLACSAGLERRFA